MSTWYEAEFGSVNEVRGIERESADSVWIKGMRRAKKSTWRPLFATAEEAWDWNVAQAQAEVDKERRSLAYREEKLAEVKDARAKALLK
jgi:hypothetical protein